MNRRSFILFCPLLALPFVACKSTASLKTETPARIVRLNENFGLENRIGELPYQIDAAGNAPVARYAIYPKGHSPEYLVMFSPKNATGDITIPIRKDLEHIESAPEYNRYIDLLLRAHRQLLRNKISQAKRTLEGMRESYDTTYGGLILKGNIALMERRIDAASRYYARAERVFPAHDQNQTAKASN